MQHSDPDSAGRWMRAIAARWVVIVTAVVIGLAAALVISMLLPRQEGASATVLPVAAGGALDPSAGDTLPRIAASVQLLAESDPVLQRAAQGYAQSAPGRSAPSLDDMRDRISASVPGEGALVNIEATGASAAEAVALGTAEIDALAAVVAGLTPAGSAAPGIRISQVGPPIPIGVVSPRPVANAALGGVAGLLVGLGVVLLLPGVRGARSARTAPPRRGPRAADDVTPT